MTIYIYIYHSGIYKWHLGFLLFPSLIGPFLNVACMFILKNNMHNVWKNGLICPTITMVSTKKFCGFNKYRDAFQPLIMTCWELYLAFSTHKVIYTSKISPSSTCMHESSKSFQLITWGYPQIFFFFFFFFFLLLLLGFLLGLLSLVYMENKGACRGHIYERTELIAFY